jgi:hypothetical protein
MNDEEATSTCADGDCVAYSGHSVGKSGASGRSGLSSFIGFSSGDPEGAAPGRGFEQVPPGGAAPTY